MLSLRMAEDDDGAAIAAIYAPYVQSTAISFEEVPPTAAQITERMARGRPAHLWMVAEADSQVVGYAYSSRHAERASYRWSVDVSVYLDGAWHRRGIGRALYTTLLAALQAQGFAHAYAGITLPNASSIALHEAMGFAHVGVYTAVGHKLGAWRDVGWWERALARYAGEPAATLSVEQLLTSGRWQSCMDAGARSLREHQPEPA